MHFFPISGLCGSGFEQPSNLSDISYFLHLQYRTAPPSLQPCQPSPDPEVTVNPWLPSTKALAFDLAEICTTQDAILRCPRYPQCHPQLLSLANSSTKGVYAGELSTSVSILPGVLLVLDPFSCRIYLRSLRALQEPMPLQHMSWLSSFEG